MGSEMCIRDSHKTLKPVYKTVTGWSEDISGIRHFADLPEAAKVYVAWLLKALIEVANHGDQNKDKIPNLRYIGSALSPARSSKMCPLSKSFWNSQFKHARKNHRSL